MTSKQFNDALVKLRLSVYASAPVLGISLRQAQRYSAGEQDVSAPVANYLTLLVQMVDGWRAERKKLQGQLAFFERTDAVMRSNGKDITAGWIVEVKRQLADYEALLRSGGDGSGLPPQID